MSEPVEPTPDGTDHPQDGDTASPRPGRQDAGSRPGGEPDTPASDHAAADHDREAQVDEPSGAQGTGGTGVPVSDEPGVAMPKPTEDPGRVRGRAEPEPEPAGGTDGAETGGPAPPGPVGWLPRGAEEIFGPGATAELAYELLTVDVPPERWITALEAARDELGCTYFDWLSAVDEPGTGFQVCAHVAALPAEPGDGVRRLLVRTTVPHEAPVLPTATAVYAGAAWHERETHEMFGVGFTDHPHLVPLLLPDGFEGHPLRKDFVLAARVVKAWPGAKEPGESGHGGPKRRQMLPPGVPDPNEWGPLKGTLPPAPSRPARGRAAAGGDRPARRTRSASAGSASQRPAPPPEGETDEAPATEATRPPARPARRTRSASEGSASRRDAGPGDAPEAPDAREAAQGEGGEQSRGAPRSADAPWHHARPAHGEGATEPGAVDEGAPEEGAAAGDAGDENGGSNARGEDNRGNDDETGGER